MNGFTDQFGSGCGGRITQEGQVVPVGIEYKLKKCDCSSCPEYYHPEIKLEQWYKDELSSIIREEVRDAITSLLKDRVLK